jgi:hypothetical protein
MGVYGHNNDSRNNNNGKNARCLLQKICVAKKENDERTPSVLITYGFWLLENALLSIRLVYTCAYVRGCYCYCSLLFCCVSTV